jgi:inosose dehydratase
MSASRRDFLLGLAAAGVIARVPFAAHASPASGVSYPPMDLSLFDQPLHHGDAEIRIGYAAITWDGKDTQAIEDISAAGYKGIQLRANAVTEFPDAAALRDLLAKHNLQFVALSSGQAPLDPAQRQSTLDTHLKNAQYLHAAGGKYLQIIGNFSKDRVYTADDYKYEGELLTEIGKHAAEFGIQTGFHNHMGSIGQTPEAVDAILSAADPKYVKLELDTAHYAQGGGGPAAAIRKYGRRILFLHLKDVMNASTTSNGYEFVELGQGRVDFKAVFESLNAIHFRGWGVVELDGERPNVTRTPRQSAEMSKAYLEEKIGIQV